MTATMVISSEIVTQWTGGDAQDSEQAELHFSTHMVCWLHASDTLSYTVLSLLGKKGYFMELDVHNLNNSFGRKCKEKTSS